MSGKAMRKTGRPAIISREQILDRALELASATPGTPLTLSAIARDLGVTTMALYRYFCSKDELLQALSAHLLERLDIVPPKNATPAEKIATWSRCVRAHFLKHPQLINMLAWEGGHSSVAWLDRSRLIFEALEEIGFAEQRLVV